MDNDCYYEYTKDKPLRVLELYAGIGGMHFAVKNSGTPFKVIQAFEINPNVLETYAHNFPDKVITSRNIESITADEINKMNIDIILMSPPCQPFCRTGRKQDIQDTRSSSLALLLKILPEINFTYLLLENVKGFECSDARDELLQTLRLCNMKWQEFLLNPPTISVPNSRLRYYVIAKKSGLTWSFDCSQDILLSELPLWKQVWDDDNDSNSVPYFSIVKRHTSIWTGYGYTSKLRCPNTSIPCSSNNRNNTDWCVADIMDYLSSYEEYLVPENLIKKYGISMDIVYPQSTQTNCFTKAYGTYIKGSGSYLVTNVESADSNSIVEITDSESIICNLKKMKLRYFTPREISRLLYFPSHFTFPSQLSNKQRYKALRNNINIYVVSILISLLVSK